MTLYDHDETNYELYPNKIKLNYRAKCLRQILFRSKVVIGNLEIDTHNRPSALHGHYSS